MSHSHHHPVKGKRLIWSIILNVSITILEAIGGILSGSISLLSDAVHNFSDVLSLVISYIANRLTHKSATVAQTYGFKRSEVVAAFINSSTLLVLAIFILVEGIKRFINPIAVSTDWVIWLAIVSIVVNGLSVIFIRQDAKNNMNIKSAYLHLFSDMLTSVAVLIGGIGMKYFNLMQIDSILSILIAVYLLYSSWGILKSALKIIMQFTPENIDIDRIANIIEQINTVKNIHHIHIWQINEHDIMFESHIDLNKNITIAEFEKTLLEIKNTLSSFNINHVTIQPEYNITDNKHIINK